MTNITNILNGDTGRFEMTCDGQPAGKMDYMKTSDDKITITHTEVNGEFGGKGLGGKLVETAVDYAMENNLKIVPACSFARHILEKDASYKDVLAI